MNIELKDGTHRRGMLASDVTILERGVRTTIRCKGDDRRWCP